jgi:flagellar biosynthesis protein FliQ
MGVIAAMTQAMFLDLLQETVLLILMLSAPVLIVAMTVGLLISLLQAVTQIQEATLTFVPKILASLLTLVVAAPWMLNVFIDHTQRLLQNLAGMTGH